MTKKVIKQYTEMAGEYDVTIRQLVPQYDQMMKRMVNFLPFEKNQSLDFLDIGCGTGNLALLLKKKYFYSQLTCIDATEKMIAAAQEKLRDYHSIDFICSPVQKFSFKKRAYDAVVVSMVFQNLENQRQKMSLYKKICQSLKPDGFFLMFGPVKASNALIEEYYMDQWSRYLQKSFSRDEAEGTCLTRYNEKDGPVSFLEELEMLQKSGFNSVDVIYKHNNLTLWVATNQ